jgi:hypothetical protein
MSHNNAAITTAAQGTLELVWRFARSSIAHNPETNAVKTTADTPAPNNQRKLPMILPLLVMLSASDLPA